jgi:hypothetical protein
MHSYFFGDTAAFSSIFKSMSNRPFADHLPTFTTVEKVDFRFVLRKYALSSISTKYGISILFSFSFYNSDSTFTIICFDIMDFVMAKFSTS